MRWPFFHTNVESESPLHTHRLRGRRARRRRLAALGYAMTALFLSVVGANATTVVPPNFSELVAESDVVARGTVKSVESRWVETAGRPVIKTFVTFAVQKTIKGNAEGELTLEFLGGTVGADSMHVTGMPSFKPGDCDIVFVSGNGARFCPLVRFAHGRYRVQHDSNSGRSVIARDDRRPLESVADVQLPADAHDHGKAMMHGESAALSCEEFEAQIAAEMARASR